MNLAQKEGFRLPRFLQNYFSRKHFLILIMAKLKFVVDDLLPQLSQVVGVVNSKNSLPILNDVLFVTRIGNGSDERRLSLTTSDS